MKVLSCSLPGPWLSAFYLHIPFALKSKSNFRRSSNSKIWDQEKSFSRDISILAANARPSAWPLGDINDSLSQRPIIIATVFAVSTLDTANLSKSILDAMETVVYHNDAQVRCISAVSTRSRTNQQGGVAVAALHSESSLATIIEAAAKLTESSLPVFLDATTSS